MLKNLMESLVLDKIEKLSYTINFCSCEKCVVDIASYALNRLPPKYIVTQEGELMVKLEACGYQYDLDITSMIMKAIMIVAKNPSHQ